MSEILSAQVTAVATLALAVLALAAAVLAGLAFWKQSQEVGLLLEQNKRDTDQRRTSQAAQIFLGVPRDEKPDETIGVHPYVRNASDFPAYDVGIAFGMDPGLTELVQLMETVMPGETVHTTHPVPYDKASSLLYLMFRDSAGINWARSPDGSLKESRSPWAPTEQTAP